MIAPVHVAVAAIVDPDDRVLITLRHKDSHQGGLWEFPGGKVEEGELVLQALRREIEEEVGLVIDGAEPLIRIHHDYTDKQVLLDVWLVTDFHGDAHGRENQQWQWVDKFRLDDFSFPLANGPIIKAVQLPDFYLVTPEPEANRSAYLQRLSNVLNRGIKLVQFRAKSLSDSEYQVMAADILNICRESGARLMLNADPELLAKVPADGIHLTSTRLNELHARPLDKAFLISASCHNETEIHRAEQLNIDFAVVAPVLVTETHPTTKALGWGEFGRLAEMTTMPCYALGGMSPEHLSQSRALGGRGIAAIRSLWNSTVEL